ncbi:MAG TPA: hypothetical protein VKB86_15505 [Pyrinomonadaceae bacterium]|nr:hypothetical protein [Pyrinomonadaceae bacterium]
MDVNFIARVLELHDSGAQHWKHHDPEAKDDFEKLVTLCEERGEYPDQYVRSLQSLVDINNALGNEQKAAYYQRKLAKFASEA